MKNCLGGFLHPPEKIQNAEFKIMESKTPDGALDIPIYINKMLAGVAQSVVHLIRNQKVTCSSHATSSMKKAY